MFEGDDAALKPTVHAGTMNARNLGYSRCAAEVFNDGVSWFHSLVVALIATTRKRARRFL